MRSKPDQSLESAIAHSAEDGRVHLLSEHLAKTAELASEFATSFSSPGWAHLAGLWHDLGKFSKAFQEYIRAAASPEAHIERGGVRGGDHSSFGALKAIERLGVPGRVLAYVIAGHHAGLPDWQTEGSGMSGLSYRLTRQSDDPPVISVAPPNDLMNHQMPADRPPSATDPAMWIRMLFSCVVDADFLDTEGFFSPEKSAARKKFPRFDDLLPRFDDYMRAKFSQVDRTSVNQLRSLVLETCIAKSHLPPGIFSLTVPTGGGKTLGSTAFALHHGAHHEKRRLIYVIPYTSITEQTANQLREIFPDAVVEHHSNIVEENSEDSARNRLASENWDAPVIVTTTVQFFESLFAARPSKCRKLHNIVNSVVILDEIQLLPTDFLRPILRALTELTRRYKVTLVLSTATQPALKSQTNSEAVFEGLPDVTEIIDKPEEVYTRMRRTAITVPKDLQTPIAWEALANELQRHPTVLCIVNRRDDCRTLHALMPRGTIHLSALMCGAHRSNVIGKLKELLKEKIPVRVISTQLVEAGVDLDFPVVFRALAGLDSIAQAAGRCNREGLLEKGEVRLFVPPSKTPRGYLAQAAEITKRLLSANAGGDPLALPEFTKFFKELYWLRGDRLDAHGILVDLAADPQLRFSFRTAADKFAIIDDRLSVPIAVQYEEGIQLLDRIGQRGLDRMLRRQLQRYIVTVPQWVFTGLVNAGQVEEIATGLWAQSALGKYDLVVGLHVGDVLINPSDLIVEPNDKGTIP